MLNFIISLFLGMLPEVLFFTLFLTYTKDLKDKRLKLFGLLAIGYVLLIMICRYEFIFYIAFIVYEYIIIKILYRASIIDIFVCFLSFCYLMIIGLVFSLLFLDSYVLYYILARIFLFIPFIFRHKFNNVYNKYCYMWNRHKDNKIKSITIRNASLLFVNILIVLLDIVLLLVITDFSKIGG